ncbi:hypothetical protein ABZ897_39770 [Nonomuraea sp. NPDC046802]|uniref:DUF4097 family beta strand repeat-containing protein n=1 Tax=Nonomuraea sp. NPDC046802 TaxID=3154919 RepID=UPI0034044792
MRAAWLTAGALATVIGLTLSTTLIWVGFARARTPSAFSERSIPFTQDEIRIKVTKGQVNVHILPGEAGELLVNRRLRWSGERPDVSDIWDTGTRTLRLEAVCPGYDQPEGPICQADYMLFLPPETDVDASTTVGDLNIDGMFGDVRLTSVSGTINAVRVSGDLWARSGSGLIQANLLKGDRADLEIGSGDVYASFADPPANVRAVVRTTGDVTVLLPEGDYDVTTEAARTALDVDKAPGAPRKVTAEAPNGTVRVCCD